MSDGPLLAQEVVAIDLGPPRADRPEIRATVTLHREHVEMSRRQRSDLAQAVALLAAAVQTDDELTERGGRAHTRLVRARAATRRFGPAVDRDAP